MPKILRKFLILFGFLKMKLKIFMEKLFEIKQIILIFKFL
jgi:hypothetical protein